MRRRPVLPTNPCPFAPGDEVLRYVQGVPVPCVVVLVINREKILIRADCWPMGCTATVHASDVVLLARKSDFGWPA